MNNSSKKIVIIIYVVEIKNASFVLYQFILQTTRGVFETPNNCNNTKEFLIYYQIFQERFLNIFFIMVYSFLFYSILFYSILFYSILFRFYILFYGQNLYQLFFNGVRQSSEPH